MTHETNVDFFRLYAGRTFAQLYSSFPIRSRLDAVQMVEDCGTVISINGRTRQLEIINATWRWLAETGFLDHDPSTNTYNLTPRSFEGLTFLDDQASGVCRGDQLRELAQRTVNASVAQSVAEIVTKILGSGARAAYSFLA